MLGLKLIHVSLRSPSKRYWNVGRDPMKSRGTSIVKKYLEMSLNRRNRSLKRWPTKKAGLRDRPLLPSCAQHSSYMSIWHEMPHSKHFVWHQTFKVYFSRKQLQWNNLLGFPLKSSLVWESYGILQETNWYFDLFRSYKCFSKEEYVQFFFGLCCVCTY